MSDVTLSGQPRSARESKAQPVVEPNGPQSVSAVRRVLTGLAAFGFLLPVAAYFWFVHQYGVNMIWHDQWDDVLLISHSHTLGLGALWSQHYENRIFFPNLIVLLLAYTTHLNVVVEEYLSGAMLVVATGLLIWAHKRRSPSIPWIYYSPVAILLLSFVQYENTLWGFQMAWYLVFLSLAAAVVILDRAILTWLVLTGAILAGIVGSFSSLQGLLIWPAGLVLLYHRRRPKSVVVAWITAAVTTGAVYFWGFNFTQTGNYGLPYSYAVQHPITAIKFFFVAIGDVVGANVPSTPSASYDAVLALGVLIFLLAISIVIAYGFRRDKSRGNPIGVTLVCFGLLFAAVITQGRSSSGSSALSRYTTFDLLIVVGCYLVLLDRPPPRGNEGRASRIALPVFRAALVGVICLQVVLGTGEALTSIRAWHQDQIAAADVTVNIDKASDALVQDEIARNSSARQYAQIARFHHLSLFATDAVSYYTREGLFSYFSVLRTSVLRPANGATVSGDQLLDASASDMSGVTKVAFHLTGGTLNDSLIATAGRTYSGWLAYWKTTNVANGTYTLESDAYGAYGKNARSATVVVKIDN